MNITTTDNLRAHFAFLRERYQILLRRRAGLPAPWTDDPILQKWRFTNVFREDDRTTIAFRETVRDPLRDDPHVFLATIVWRWFNLIETGQILQPFLMSHATWNRRAVEQLLWARASGGDKVFTGAFMVYSPPYESKITSILDNIDWCYKFVDVENVARNCKTKRKMFECVKEIPNQGPFTAYQVVADLLHTSLLEHASDFNTFTVAGPGCTYGIGRVFYDDPQHFKYGNRGHQSEMSQLMIATLALSRDPELWPAEWPSFTLCDIENSFCEAHKYGGAREGNHQKRRFKVTG